MTVLSAPPRIIQANPVWAAATGPQNELVTSIGNAVRLDGPAGTFAGVHDVRDRRAWHDLRSLFAEGETATMIADRITVPPDWRVVEQDTALQLIGRDVLPAVRAGRTILDPEIVPLDLWPAAPGPPPWSHRIGVRRSDRWSAVAGERLRAPGWVEIAAGSRSRSSSGREVIARLAAASAVAARRRGYLPFILVRADDARLLTRLVLIGFGVAATARIVRVRAC
jgi:hypothetical protein